MSFSENLKQEVKEKAAFRCCRCQAIGVQVHHIEPESEGGPDTVENAAPLCPCCHDYFGANPQKRKEIKHMRDWWYQRVELQYPNKYATFEQLSEISRKLEEIRQGQSSGVTDLKNVMKSILDKMVESISTKNADTTALVIIDTSAFMSEVTIGGEMALGRSNVKELHYIVPIANMVSIMQHGILSNKLIKKLFHESFADEEIQYRRENIQVPGGRKLQEYANLYFDAHNPMLCKCKDQNNKICVLRINAEVMDLPGVTIADQNASSNYVRFYPVEEGLAAIDQDRLFARHWTHPDNQYEEWSHKSLKCAEVLVPDKIEPRYLTGAYVANQTALAAIEKLHTGLTVHIRSDIFF
ncbi:MAG: DarT ssDNA thymidine ADP-ribosyltransferase family protein [Planctomycetota bacterium]